MYFHSVLFSWFSVFVFFFSSRRRHTRLVSDWSSDVCSSDLTGITSNLSKRVFQHKTGAFPGFTSRYRIDRLVHYERFISVAAAIQREKQIKGLLRIKKLALIVSMNPEWKDLSEGWYSQDRPEKCQDKRIDPSPSASPRESSGSG